MLAFDALGRFFLLVRRPKPDGPRAFFTLERIDVLEGHTETIHVPYTPRPLESRDVRAWAAALGAVERIVELGLFPSHAAGVGAVLDALDEPEYHSPVQNLGRGLVDEAVLVDAGGAVWLCVSDNSSHTNDRIVVSGETEVSHSSVADGIRLLAVGGDLAWGEVLDGFGVPNVHVYQVRPAGR